MTASEHLFPVIHPVRENAAFFQIPLLQNVFLTLTRGEHGTATADASLTDTDVSTLVTLSIQKSLLKKSIFSCR